jgi:hypothetical protein
MEHRHDLEDILFSGLPPAERQHVATVIRETDAAKLRRKRAQQSSDSVVFADPFAAQDDNEIDQGCERDDPGDDGQRCRVAKQRDHS